MAAGVDARVPEEPALSGVVARALGSIIAGDVVGIVRNVGQRWRWAMLALLLGVAGARAQPVAPPAAIAFSLRAPMAVGTVWQYEGTLRYPRALGDTVTARVPDWRTTVVSSVRRDERDIAVVQDLPTDLLRGIRMGERQYSVLASSSTQLWFAQAPSRAAADSIQHAWSAAMPDSEAMVLRAPVRVQQRAPDRGGKVADGFWEWTVTGLEAAPRVFGATATGPAVEVLRHQRVDAVTLEWTPGMGLTRVEYLHFGDQRRGNLRLRRVRYPGAGSGREE
jgi:hypothetical protein